ncbi:MAG: hypothetical protein U0625_11325 [Phycisphaerales bacterium]
MSTTTDAAPEGPRSVQGRSRGLWIPTRVSLRLFLAVLGIVAVLGLLAIFSPSVDGRLVGSAAILAGMCLMLFLAGVPAERWGARWLCVVGAGAAIVAGMLGLVLAWVPIAELLNGPDQDWNGPGYMAERHLVQVTAAFVQLALLCIFVAWITGPRHGSGPIRLLQRGVAGAAIACGTIGIAGTIFPERVWPFLESLFIARDLFYRVFVAVMLLTAAGAIALPILLLQRRLREAQDNGSALRGQRTRVALRCPRCAQPLEIEANAPSECGACRLALRIELQEPRCACGYLLYRIDAPACPECGRPIDEDKRWKGTAAGQGA